MAIDERGKLQRRNSKDAAADGEAAKRKSSKDGEHLGRQLTKMATQNTRVDDNLESHLVVGCICVSVRFLA